MKLAFMYVTQVNSTTSLWYVAIAKSFSYGVSHVNWMGLNQLKDYNPITEVGTLIPQVDIMQSIHEFETEKAAIQFMTEFYSYQLNNTDKVNSPVKFMYYEIKNNTPAENTYDVNLACEILKNKLFEVYPDPRFFVENT